MVSMEESALVERAGRVGHPFSRDSFDNDNTNENHNGFSGRGWRQQLENGDYEKPSERRGGYRPKRGDYNNGDAT